MIPNAAAYSINANSETNGAPAPATGSALSANNPTHSAGSASFSSAHSIVSSAFSTSAREISAAFARNPSSTSAVLLVVSDCGGGHGTIQAPATDTHGPESELSTGLPVTVR